ncbi:MAG: hypothetical protein OEQ90_06915 [Gammaproteobacteria bacterium]|nr:hypothetical protein [Gammaproteobacteria bacterium]
MNKSTFAGHGCDRQRFLNNGGNWSTPALAVIFVAIQHRKAMPIR